MRLIMPVGPSHRDDGACFYMHKFFNLMSGVTCDRKTMYERPKDWGEFDATVMIDWGQDNFPHLPSTEVPPEKPSLCWQSDTHWTEAAKAYRYLQVQDFRVAAMCQKNAAEEVANLTHAKTIWLPHAADHTTYTPPMVHPLKASDLDPATLVFQNQYQVVSTWDLCFVGHIGDKGREEVLERMFSAIPNFTFEPGVFFQDAARIYHQSALVFNHSVRGELNMRTFEALASRSCLLTDAQIGMEDVGLKHTEHCLIYHSVEEAVELAKEWSDPSKRQARRDMAERGWRWALAGHTYWHRARTILGMVT